MRIFWAFMLVLALGAAGVLASRYIKDEGPNPALAVERAMTTQTREPQPIAQQPVPTTATAEIPSTASAEPSPVAAAESSQEGPPSSTTEVVINKPPAADPSTAETTQPLTLDALLGLANGEPSDTAPTPESEVVESQPKPASAPVVAGEELAPGVILNEEGNLMVAGRFTIPGEGTAEKPYVISWNLLLAVQEHYRPRQGMTEIPAWITFFENKHVRLTGFVLPPMMGDDMREVLLMQNEWDGCCVGVPPTPYDAIEVKLTRNPRGLSQYTMNFGEITGIFKVDPFVQGEWLLGLYLMERADLVIKGL